MNRVISFFEKFYEENDEVMFNLLIEGNGIELWYNNIPISDLELGDDCITISKDTSMIIFDINDEVDYDEWCIWCKNKNNLTLTITMGNLF